MLSQSKNIFIIGIKGVAMVNLARMLSQMGKHVSGSDTSEEFITDNVLTESNIKLIHSFTAESLPKETDLVIYSAAHGGTNNAQVQEAIKRNIQVMHQIEALGEIMNTFRTSIAVCGCHGKTGTSALLSYALKKLGAEQSYMVGVSTFIAHLDSKHKDEIIMGLPRRSTPRNDVLLDEHYGGEYTGKDIFVIEADEYGLNPPHNKTPKLNFLNPTHALCMNIDFDHPDVYESLQQTKETFLEFFKRVIRNSDRIENPKSEILSSKNENNIISQRSHVNCLLFFCTDDGNLMDVAKSLPRESYLTYGFGADADVKIIEMESTEENTEFSLIFNEKTKEILNTFQDDRGTDVLNFSIELFGEKSVSNATGVICFLLSQGFDSEKIQKAIKDFSGAKRRFEKVFYGNDTYIFDDYGHHPHEIEATISAVRSRFPTRRLIVLFQPHTFSRTESLKTEFVQALSLSDESLILPIFGSARETVAANSITSVDLQTLATKRGIGNVKGFSTKEEVIEKLKEIIKPGDVIFTMGAGDVYKLCDAIAKIIDHLSSSR